jgi:WhiB family transcriptional regulator, redox-sensing transcriptional regulator
MDMYWPGTTATAAGRAGFEADPARSLARHGAGTAAAVTADAARSGLGTVTFPVVRQAPRLPCMDDPDLFFAESPQDVETAKALCQSCPVRLRCFAGAMERREPWGVWGGELFLRGEVVPRKRPRGRPRKSEVAA